MSDINSLPTMGYVPTQKIRAPVFLFPPEPIAIMDPELGHLGGNVQKRNSPRKGKNSQEPSLGELRNGDNDSPRKQNRIPGEWGIPQERGSRNQGNRTKEFTT
jgi:hypothetical protein